VDLGKGRANRAIVLYLWFRNKGGGRVEIQAKVSENFAPARGGGGKKKKKKGPAGFWPGKGGGRRGAVVGGNKAERGGGENFTGPRGRRTFDKKRFVCRVGAFGLTHLRVGS